MTAKEDAYSLARLFVHKLKKPTNVDAVKKYDNSIDDLVNLIVQHADNRKDETIKNIIYCCLLHGMLLDKYNDLKKYTEICKKITEIEYIPAHQEASAVSGVAAVFDTIKEELPVRPVQVLDFSKPADVLKLVTNPTRWTCKELNNGTLNSLSNKTLWNFLCERRHILPVAYKRSEFVNAFTKATGSSMPEQTLLLFMQQLLLFGYEI
jgi:hypothetical protein